ncbi:hypothetical protein JHK85_002535 [Glycine max]|nr:hypothetical protein JHK85_002535 [Glycine max]KHN42728.1 hypothetical protein glysoja_018971 [Glycine soja]
MPTDSPNNETKTTKKEIPILLIKEANRIAEWQHVGWFNLTWNTTIHSLQASLFATREFGESLAM